VLGDDDYLMEVPVTPPSPTQGSEMPEDIKLTPWGRGWQEHYRRNVRMTSADFRPNLGKRVDELNAHLIVAKGWILGFLVLHHCSSLGEDGRRAGL
jgi:hypothetical protein